MPNAYIFVPPEREAEIIHELRRHERYSNTLRSFIEHYYPDYRDPGWYQASKLVYDVFRLIDPAQPDGLRVNAARRLLSRLGEVMPLWRWSLLAPNIAVQATRHKRLLAVEIEQCTLAVLFHLLYEESDVLQDPDGDFYTTLRKKVAGQVTTDVLGQGWSRRLKRHREVIVDPLALQEIAADITLENLPVLDEVFSALSGRQLELMSLRYIDGLTVRDIANRCQLSISAVTSQLTKARNSLRRHYS